MKDLQYTTIASDSHSIQVSTWKQRDKLDPDVAIGNEVWVEQWHYKFKVNGNLIDEGVLGPVDEDDSVNADQE